MDNTLSRLQQMRASACGMLPLVDEIRRINWTAPVWSAMFIDGSDVALVGSEDGLVSVWDVTTPDTDALIDWIQENRYVVELTCEQLSEIAVQEDC